MTNVYAGTGYNTARAATRAAVIDWVTAGGNNGSPEQCVQGVEENLEAFAIEFAECGWVVPNVPDSNDPEVTRELLLDFIEEFGNSVES